MTASRRPNRRGAGPRGPMAPPGNLLQSMKHATGLYRQGRLEEAIAAFRAILKQAPRLPEAHHNLGVALRARSDLAGAAKAYRNALSLAPDYASAHRNLAATLALQGRPQESLAHFLQALRLKPSDKGTLRGFASVLPQARFNDAGPAVTQAVEACLTDDGIEHQTLVPAVLSLLRLDPRIAEALTLAGDADEAKPAGDALDAVAGNRLLVLLLTRTVVPDIDFEGLLTALRRSFLLALDRDGPQQEKTPDIAETKLDFAAALACQCELTGYAYPVSDSEAAILSRIESGGPPVAGKALPEAVAMAMYRPLAATVWADRLAEPRSPPLDLLRHRLVEEPAEEARLAATIPRLTPVDDEVSRAVRDQYEAHPYPRWRATRDREARPLQAVVAGLFPHLGRLDGARETMQILVAGCGTGKHAVDVATRYSNAEVLAIDLSLAALAYGSREAKARSLANLSFAHADILALGGLDRRFHLIESVGVLHHLKDPLAGWRILTGLLEPGGFLRLGFYSERARGAIRTARGFIEDRGFAADSAGIREARQAILALAPDDPRREVAGELDFYSLHGCRDLLFNVQETAFTVPQLAAAIDALGLTFLGFEFHEPALPQAYRRRFPDDPAMTDLANWDRFEAEHPESFGRMYQFWCRAPG